jgi:hypothetical protein
LDGDGLAAARLEIVVSIDNPRTILGSQTVRRIAERADFDGLSRLAVPLRPVAWPDPILA